MVCWENSRGVVLRVTLTRNTNLPSLILILHPSPPPPPAPLQMTSHCKSEESHTAIRLSVLNDPVFLHGVSKGIDLILRASSYEPDNWAGPVGGTNFVFCSYGKFNPGY